MKGTTVAHGNPAQSRRQKHLLDKWLDVVKLLALDRIHTDDEYDRVVAFMQEVIAEIGDAGDEHPLCALLDIIDMRIRAYDDAHHPVKPVTGVEMLKGLMEIHDLKQIDMEILGSQGVVSEILSGKRELNVRQIKALAARFHVSPAVFLPEA
ncbi:MAG TPA: transcriptional regulator [Candidatus Ozemobacteraceae bacterium]|nr:transcriptional regulator [Candidatus Ozemobacteraceae bacterium]